VVVKKAFKIVQGASIKVGRLWRGNRLGRCGWGLCSSGEMGRRGSSRGGRNR
jgi:hypothetical protein